MTNYKIIVKCVFVNTIVQMCIIFYGFMYIFRLKIPFVFVKLIFLMSNGLMFNDTLSVCMKWSTKNHINEDRKIVRHL